ncbi:hypothetical protein GF352_04685 [archaeon]|nr:hypothetical protein [archaeon]
MIYPGFILNCLVDFIGSTQYRAVKEISRRHDLATSTIKYVFRKLVAQGLIFYDSAITFTLKGMREVLCDE